MQPFGSQKPNPEQLSSNKNALNRQVLEMQPQFTSFQINQPHNAPPNPLKSLIPTSDPKSNEPAGIIPAQQLETTNVVQPPILVEVTQLRMQPYNFPYMLPNNNPASMNGNPVIMGVPVLGDEFDNNDRENPQSYRKGGNSSRNYSDNLRMQKFELEQKISLVLENFLRQNKISLVIMILLLVSALIQLKTSELMNESESNSSLTKQQQQQKEAEEASSNSTSLYYYIANFALWMCACISAIYARKKYNVRLVGLYQMLLTFSIVPQIVGCATVTNTNKINEQYMMIAVNSILCFLELIYKIVFGIMRSRVIKQFFQQHQSQFQGYQVHLLNHR